jgi:hypothetical protein
MDDVQNPDVIVADGEGKPDGPKDETVEKLRWRSELPEQWREHEFFTPYQTKKDFWKGHFDIATRVKELDGKLATAIPKLSETATDEDKAAFYKAIGRPDKPEEYELTKPEVPDGLQLDPGLENWYRTTAHSLGLSKAQAKGLYESYNKVLVETFQAHAQIREKALNDGKDAIKKEWGNEYDNNVKRVQLAQEKLMAGDGTFKQWLTDHNAENDPALLRMFLHVSKAISDDTAPPASPMGGGPVRAGMTYPDMGKT